MAKKRADSSRGGRKGQQKSGRSGPASEGKTTSNKSASTGKTTSSKSLSTGKTAGKASKTATGAFVSKTSSRSGVAKSVATARPFKGAGGGVIPSEPTIVDFRPEAGSVVIRYRTSTRRFVLEKSPEEMVVMGDYHRARKGFSSDLELAEILGVHRTRLAAWKAGSALPEAENARLLSHLAVVVDVLDRFLDPDVIPDWLLTEQLTLGDRTPIDALRAGHLTEVLQVANATEHGAYV